MKTICTLLLLLGCGSVLAAGLSPASEEELERVHRHYICGDSSDEESCQCTLTEMKKVFSDQDVIYFKAMVEKGAEGGALKDEALKMMDTSRKMYNAAKACGASDEE